MRRLLLLLALLPALAWGEVTTGGVNFADATVYTKPQFYPITVPTEADVTNKYYVDLDTGGGSTCSSGSPCANINDVSGKPGTSGGPAYIYVRGTGRLNLTSSQLAGGAGTEIVVKPWGTNPVVFTAGGGCGSNDANTILGPNTHHVIFDGGPDMLLQFEGVGTCSDQNAYTLVVRSDDIALYRVRIDANDSSGPALGVATNGTYWTSRFKFINSEIMDANDYYGVYTGGGVNCATGDSRHFDIEFRNSVFRDIGGRGIQIEPRSGTADSDGLIITGNAFHNVGKTDIGGVSAAVTLASACGANVTDTTVTNNIMWDLGGGGVYLGGWTANTEVAFNTIYDFAKATPYSTNSHGITCGASGDCPTTGGTRNVRYNIIMGQNGGMNPINNNPHTTNANLCASGACGTSSVTDSVVNTLNTAADANFLKIKSGSLGVGAAASIGVTTDYFGNSRPQAGTYDIGASEYNAGGPDTTPDAFSFTDQTNVALSTLTASNTLTVAGIDSAATISVTGGEYRINGGSYTTSSGTINNGDTFQVRHTSSGSFSTATNTVLTIGGVSDTFTTTTLAADTTPNAFTFTDQTNVPLSDVRTSNSITVLGINTSTAISVTGGTYSINGGAYTASAGTVVLNDTVTARHTSSASYSTAVNTAVTIGGVADTFTSTTLAAPPPSDPVLGGFWWD